MTRPRLLASLLSFLLAASAMAQQEVREYGPGDTVDPQEVAAILGQSPNDAPAMKMRSLRLLDGKPSAAKVASALSLPVQFAFDSANILPAARRQLDALAQGIRLLPAAKPVVIEGHTDAVGTPEYNEQLSLRRANAVKHYLVAAHRLDPARLRTVGLGERQPTPGRDPKAAQNRRVQFHGD